MTYGIPRVLRTDGATVFESEEMKQFLMRMKVNHRISLPHYPQANPAESSVRVIKSLMKKAGGLNDKF